MKQFDKFAEQLHVFGQRGNYFRKLDNYLRLKLRVFVAQAAAFQTIDELVELLLVFDMLAQVLQKPA